MGWSTAKRYITPAECVSIHPGSARSFLGCLVYCGNAITGPTIVRVELRITEVATTAALNNCTRKLIHKVGTPANKQSKFLAECSPADKLMALTYRFEATLRDDSYG